MTRGHTDGPGPVPLPDGWLDLVDDPTPPAGAELLVSGGLVEPASSPCQRERRPLAPAGREVARGRTAWRRSRRRRRRMASCSTPALADTTTTAQSSPSASADLAHGGEAVLAGHHHVDHDGVGVPVLGDGDGLVAVGGLADVPAVELEQPGDQAADARIVLGDEGPQQPLLGASTRSARVMLSATAAGEMSVQGDGGRGGHVDASRRPAAMWMPTRRSAAARAASVRPGPSAPTRKATRAGRRERVARRGRGRRSSRPAARDHVEGVGHGSRRANGTCSTWPIDTRTGRRPSGSAVSGSSSTASQPKARALRNRRAEVLEVVDPLGDEHPAGAVEEVGGVERRRALGAGDDAAVQVEADRRPQHVGLGDEDRRASGSGGQPVALRPA